MRKRYEISQYTPSGGNLIKRWYLNDEGKYVLIKGNSRGGYEPYAEVLAYRLGKYLGLDVLEYWLEDAKDYPEVVNDDSLPHVSACLMFDFECERLHSFLLSNPVFEEWASVKKIDVWLDNLSKLGISKRKFIQLLVFDAFIGNTDRHRNNFEIRLEENGRISLTPILDFGMSLLAAVRFSNLQDFDGIGFDNARPFARTHYDQLELLNSKIGIPKDLFDLEKVKNITYFFSEQRDVLRAIGDTKRSDLMVKYVQKRAQKYLIPYAK